MRARMRRWVFGVVVVGVALPGCSTTCSWFGRNSDCSNNCWGKKPTPVQQGPIAGTYAQPGNTTNAPAGYPQGTTYPQGAGPGQALAPQQSPQTPVVTTSPATAPNLNTMPASPLNTPPGPLSPPPTGGITPGGAVTPGTPVSFKQLPSAEFNPNPPSNAMVQTGDGVAPPDVKGPPTIDLNISGPTTAQKPAAGDPLSKPSAFPMVLSPNDGNRSVRMTEGTIAAPTVSAPMPPQLPTAPGPESMPRGTMSMSPAGPPPLPPQPTPPSLDVK